MRRPITIGVRGALSAPCPTGPLQPCESTTPPTDPATRWPCVTPDWRTSHDESHWSRLHCPESSSRGSLRRIRGTFLQRHTDWKAQHAEVTAAATTAATAAAGKAKEADDSLRNKDRELRAHKSQLDTTQNDNKGLRDENQRLLAQLTELSGDVKNLSSKTTAMAQEITQSTEQSRQAYSTAMEASHAKDQAVTDKQTAEASLPGANRKIAQLESRIADQNGRIDGLAQSVSEKETMIAMIIRRAPGIVDLAQPRHPWRRAPRGPAGDLVTVRISDNPGAVEVKRLVVRHLQGPLQGRGHHPGRQRRIRVLQDVQEGRGCIDRHR